MKLQKLRNSVLGAEREEKYFFSILKTLKYGSGNYKTDGTEIEGSLHWQTGRRVEKARNILLQARSEFEDAFEGVEVIEVFYTDENDKIDRYSKKQGTTKKVSKAHEKMRKNDYYIESSHAWDENKVEGKNWISTLIVKYYVESESQRKEILKKIKAYNGKIN